MQNTSILTKAILMALSLVLLAGCGTQPGPIDLPTARVTPAITAPGPAGQNAGVPTATAVSQPPAVTPLSDPTPAPTATATPAPTPTPELTPEPTPEPMPQVVTLRVIQGASAAAAEQLRQRLAAAGVRATLTESMADLELDPAFQPDAPLAWEHILVPVDRMSSVLDNITMAELRDVWSGTGQSGNFTSLYPSQEIMPELIALLGEPGPAVKPQPTEALADAVWGDRMGLGIVPFEALNIRLRAVKLDGASPTDNRFVPAAWPLASRAWLVALTRSGQDAAARLADALPITNRHADRLTVLVMTGVTAMARNSAVAIERSGDYGFLARQVGPELATADLTIISNEIPFVPGCVADNTLNNLILCSKPEYFLNLELSGVDAVGLSGNHQNDFGYENMLWTLAFYREKGIPYYGGGKNAEEARRPLILEHNGNRLGFLAANQWGPERYYSHGARGEVSAWAGPDHPGSARFDLATMNADVQALAPQVDLVFVEVQHTEFNDAGDYQTEPIPLQERDFRALSDAGAAVVTGVQAHAPQALEIRNGRLILYGLGNLYFDQTWSWPTRTGLVARHTIYEGRLINTELLVTVIETNFQLRWATPQERMSVLRSVFDVSRW
ncbi:MAG: CapA family protein [Anaerolineae bacterium]